MTLYIDRCTHCAQCEESCPVDAIEMDSLYCHPAYSRDELKVLYKPGPMPVVQAPASTPAPDKPRE